MTETVEEIFYRISDMEGGEFEKVSHKLSQRPDVHAFMRLEEWFPGHTDNIIDAVGHDELFLSISEEEIEKLSENQILELVRCGVVYSEDCLVMYK